MHEHHIFIWLLVGINASYQNK